MTSVARSRSAARSRYQLGSPNRLTVASGGDGGARFRAELAPPVRPRGGGHLLAGDGAEADRHLHPDRVQLARAVDTLGYHQALGISRFDPLRFVIDEPDNALLNLASGQGRSDRGDFKEQEIYDYLKSIALAARRRSARSR